MNSELRKSDFATVNVLLKGYFQWIGPNQCKASCTVTLVRDGKKNILVDTGTRSNQDKLIAALKKNKLTPDDIDIVVITHAHTDHIENLGLFPNAMSLNMFEEKKGDRFKLSEDLLLKGEKKLTKNVTLIATPGHTDQCMTVLVQTQKGIVAIAGDLFVKQLKEKGVFVENKKRWESARKAIVKRADYIVPGHGGMFEVEHKH